ncbi:MAG: WD40/YVTN/BNR-like repeat-containing protein, partial [Gemmatimonadales bacterium]
VYKTTDGGESWTKLRDGLPDRVGRIGVAVSPADPNRVYALVEAEGDLRGLYRSDERGASFAHVSDDRNMTARPWYYMHVDAHPTERDVVFVSNEGFFRSDDAGVTITPIRTPHGDNHDLWINPRHPEIWIQSNDGGANITFNAGRTWSTQWNQPTAELYTVVADNQFPYRLYAPQQDNSTISVPSRITEGITPYQSWFAVAGCETGPIAVNPADPDVIYGGCKGEVSRYNRATGQTREIWLYPQEPHGVPNAELRYREQWNSQIRISPHDPSILYHTSQFVHVTRNEGQSWEIVSPDLTRWEEHKHLHVNPPGGPLTYDQTGVEVYGTVFAFEESPHEPGLFWAGSDDGYVHISRDGGETWANITPPGMELHTTVNEIVLSPHHPGRAFVVAHRYRMDDFRPFIYRTDDYGVSWKLLTDGSNGIPSDYPTRSLQEDPVRKGLLYAGTEFGMFISFDDGGHWQSFQLNLPITPVTDLLVHENDLVVATQGRSLWILDDLSPLQQIGPDLAGGGNHLFQPRDAYRLRLAYSGTRPGPWPENPPEGAMIFYSLEREPQGEVRLEITDQGGRKVKSYSSTPGEGDEATPISKKQGLNRLVWDLKYPAAYLAPGVNEGYRQRIAVVTGYTGGPYAVPGTYRVTLTVGDWSEMRSFEVLKDPRLLTTVAELRESFDLSIQVRDHITAIQRGVARGQRALAQLERFVDRAVDAAARRRAEAARVELESALGRLYKHGQRGDHAHLYPRLTTDYARIYTMLASSDHRPPDVAYERFRELEPVFTEAMAQLEAAVDRARGFR